MEALRYQRSVIQTGWIEGKAEGKIEGMKEGKIEVARSLKQMGLSVEKIAIATGLSINDIEYLK